MMMLSRLFDELFDQGQSEGTRLMVHYLRSMNAESHTGIFENMYSNVFHQHAKDQPMIVIFQAKSVNRFTFRVYEVIESCQNSMKSVFFRATAICTSHITPQIPPHHRTFRFGARHRDTWTFGLHLAHFLCGFQDLVHGCRCSQVDS